MRTILRFRDLRDRGIIKNWPTLRRAIDNRGFPPGFMLSPRQRCWFEDEVEAWLEARPVAVKLNAPLKGAAKRLVAAKLAREAAEAGA